MLFLRDESFASQLKENGREYYFVDDYLMNKHVRPPIRVLTCEITHAKCLELAYRRNRVPMTRLVDFMIRNEFVTPQEVYFMWEKMVPSSRKKDIVEKTALRYKSDRILNDNTWLLILLMARLCSKREEGPSSRWHPLLALDQDVFNYIMKLVPLGEFKRQIFHYLNIIDDIDHNSVSP